MPGTLYVVATPIGNLEDITYRAVRVLGEVDAIACEDTRQTQKLLQHYGVRKPLLSYHDHNEAERTEELLARLTRGESIALVSDAGTPLIADPGYRIVSAARQQNLTVVPLPGPSAAMAALSASGLPTDSFWFGGFLPAKAGARRRTLEECQRRDMTHVFYESPHRILEALQDAHELLGERPLVVARELTKIHEQFLRGTAAEIRASLTAGSTARGEFTLMIGRGGPAVTETVPVAEAVQSLVSAGWAPTEAVKAIARERDLPKREVYRLFTEAAQNP